MIEVDDSERAPFSGNEQFGSPDRFDSVLRLGDRCWHPSVGVPRVEARGHRLADAGARRGAHLGRAAGELLEAPAGSQATTIASVVVPGTPTSASNVAAFASAVTATRFASAPSGRARSAPTNTFTVPIPSFVPGRFGSPVGSIGSAAGFETPAVATASTGP